MAPGVLALKRRLSSSRHGRHRAEPWQGGCRRPECWAGGGDGAGKAGLGQAPGHAGRSADDQSDQMGQILAVDGGFSAAGPLPASP
jgi:hypothetical protein